MIVICEECGKKYQLDPSSIKGKEATATCSACNHQIKVYHPDQNIHNPVEEMAVQEEAPSNSTVSFSNHKKKKAKKRSYTSAGSKRRLFGLRGKIFSLFFVVPIALIVLAGYMFIGQLNSLSTIISDESSKMVTKMAEDIIRDKGRAVTREVKLYLETHPDLKKEDFNTTPEFVNIAMQKVGETGYTCMVERETPNNPEYMWVHPKKEIIGVDITAAMKKALGDKWARWDQVRSKEHETAGYYLWIDNREKYCTGHPVEGTPFNVVSSTYIDEFTQPVKGLQAKAATITDSTRQIVLIIIGATALLVALIAFMYGHKLSSKIRNLTDVADRISVGDMDVEIESKDKDELGDLASAISRMQDSIKLSIQRLRRRKDRQAA